MTRVPQAPEPESRPAAATPEGESTWLMLATLTATLTTEPALLDGLRREVASDPAVLDALMRAVLVLLVVVGDGDPLKGLRLLGLAHALHPDGAP